MVLRGLGGCRFEPADRGARHRRRRRAGRPPSAPPGRDRTSCRPSPSAGTSRRRGIDATTAGCCGRPASGTRYAAPVALAPGLLHAVDAVQRLGPLRAPRPARLERPPLLPRRRGAALAHRAGRAADRVHRGRRLASPADLGHGHRQPGRHGRRPPRGVPHQPGRQQAADADSDGTSDGTSDGAEACRPTTTTSRSSSGSPRNGPTPVATSSRRRRGIPSSPT